MKHSENEDDENTVSILSPAAREKAMLDLLARTGTQVTKTLARNIEPRSRI